MQVRITQFLLVTRTVTVTDFGCGLYLLQRYIQKGKSSEKIENKGIRDL